MKKVLTIAAAALLVSGVAGVAIADYCWDCTATGFWVTCEFSYNPNTFKFSGFWYGDGIEGEIEGEAISQIGNTVQAEGTYKGPDPYIGTWEGFFTLGGSCEGTYLNYTAPPIPPGGSFSGSSCECE